MPKANNTNIYNYDEYPSLKDYLFGTDFENQKKNKSYRLNSIIQLINGVNGKNNLQFIFSDGSNPEIDYFSKGFFFTDTNEGSPINFTKLIINKESLQPIDLTLLFQRMDQMQNLVLKLENPADPNNFFKFYITAIDNQTNYFVFDVTIFENFFFGELLNDTIYSIYFDIKIDGLIGDNGLSAYEIAINNETFFGTELEFAQMQASVLEKLNKGTYEGNADDLLQEAKNYTDGLDLTAKENKSEKGLANGYAPLNEFVKIASNYLNIVNNLTEGGSTFILSAEQGKQLRLQVDAINSILFSDNVNLDTIQEIVDAIESVQSYLDLILVNDLITGGVTKALTAEMGKVLKALIDALNLELEATNTRVSELEGSQVFYNRFTGKSYAIWSGVGLTYDVIYTSYYLDNILYPGGTVQRTLSPSDLTNPRFDLIKVDMTGVQVATGTPSASPEIPTADPNTELAISPVLVDAGALTPTGVSDESVYKESAEWSRTTNNGTVNFNANTNPFQGTFHIDCGAFTNGQYLRFTDSVINQIADFSLLKFYVNLKATFASTAKFSVRFYNGSTSVSSTVTIASGSYNFLRTTINTYQTVIIPLSDFTFSSSNFDRIEIVMVGANTSGFRMDNIVLSQGIGSSSPEQKAITSVITDSGIANATVKDDTFQFRGASGLVVSAIGKIITFTSNFTTALKANYDSAYTWVLAHGNVDNTSDVNKPVSTLQAAADATVLADGKTYADGLITQIINGAPADANTLKELNDKIIAINALIGAGVTDGDAFVNTITELLAVFSTYTEGADLVTLLAGKVNTTDVYNALDCIVAGKVLDARQGKTLNDLITALTGIVNAKVSFPEAPIDTKQYARKDGAWVEVISGGVAEPNSATITTAVSITTATLTTGGYTQEGKVIEISNGVNAINYTINAATTASFVKGGTGAITFVQGAGRTLTGMNGTLIFNGIVGSTASLVSFGTVDKLYINNL